MLRSNRIILDRLTNNRAILDNVEEIAAFSAHESSLQAEELFAQLNAYTAVTKLVALGYREEAKVIAHEYYDKMVESSNYYLAIQISEYMHEQEGLFGSNYDAIEWQQKSLKNDRIIQTERRAKVLYYEIIHEYRTGLTIDEKKLQRILDQLENKKYETSGTFLYYYYQLKTLLHEKSDSVEGVLLEAISTYEKKYSKHTNFILIFTKTLFLYYTQNGENKEAEKILSKAINNTTYGTVPFVFIKHAEAVYYMNNKRYADSLSICKEIQLLPIFNSMPTDKQYEWEILVDKINEAIRISTTSTI